MTFKITYQDPQRDFAHLLRDVFLLALFSFVGVRVDVSGAAVDHLCMIRARTEEGVQALCLGGFLIAPEVERALI